MDFLGQLTPKKKQFERLSPIKLDENGKEKNLNDYDEISFLGQGTFAQVSKIKDKQSNNEYALKKISKDKIVLYNKIKYVGSEIDLMYKLDHPHFIKLITHFEDQDFIYMVQELAPKGTLADILDQKKKIKENQCKYYMKQIFDAISYAHSRGIIHRDIKPENIFLDSKNNIKIGDLGAGHQLDTANQFRNSHIGTTIYMAPEILLKQKYDFSVDVWSMGVLIYELLTGELPFENSIQGNDQDDIQNNILNKQVNFGEQVSQLARQMIEKMLVKDPSQRQKLQNLKNDPWFQEEQGLEGEQILLQEDEDQVSKEESMRQFLERVGIVELNDQQNQRNLEKIKQKIDEEKQILIQKKSNKIKLEKEIEFMQNYLGKSEIQNQEQLQVVNKKKSELYQEKLNEADKNILQLKFYLKNMKNEQEILEDKIEENKKKKQKIDSIEKKLMIEFNELKELQSKKIDKEYLLRHFQSKLEDVIEEKNNIEHGNMNNSRRTTNIDDMKDQSINSYNMIQRMKDCLQELASNLQLTEKIEKLINKDKQMSLFLLKQNKIFQEQDKECIEKQAIILKEQQFLFNNYYKQKQIFIAEIFELEEKLQKSIEEQQNGILLMQESELIDKDIEHLNYLIEQYKNQLTIKTEHKQIFDKQFQNISNQLLEYNPERQLFIQNSLSQKRKNSKN